MADIPSRYRDAALIGDGPTLYLGRRALPNTLPRGDDRFVTAGMEDNLHLMANRMLGDQQLWWVVADFNSVVNPMDIIPPGTVYRVPSMARLWMDVLR